MKSTHALLVPQFVSQSILYETYQGITSTKGYFHKAYFMKSTKALLAPQFFSQSILYEKYQGTTGTTVFFTNHTLGKIPCHY